MEPSLQTNLGKLVRMRLMEQDRTLRDLAEHLGMTYQNLYAILAGKTRMTLAVAKAIAGYLEISLDQLAGMEEEAEEETRGGWMASVADRTQWVKAQPAASQVYPSPAMRADQAGGPLREPTSPREYRQAFEARPSRESQAPATSHLSLEPRQGPTKELEVLLLELIRLLEKDELPDSFLRALAEKLRPYLMEAS